METVILILLGAGIVIGVAWILGKLVPYKYKLKISGDGINKASYPLIEVELNGVKKIFMIDTGADANIIADQDYRNNEMLKDLPVKRESHIIGVSSHFVCPHCNKNIVFEAVNGTIPVVEMDIKIGEETFTDEFIITSNWGAIQNEIEERCGIKPFGLLGATLFNKAKLVIDFDELIVWKKKD